MQKATLDCYQLLQFGLSREQCERLTNKTICFIRHAESLYNIDPRKQHSQKCTDASLIDCKLSEFGKVQSARIREALEQCGGVESFQLVTSSPLMRARQTAALAFQRSSTKCIIINPLIAEKVDSYSDVTRAEMGMDPEMGCGESSNIEELLGYDWPLADGELCSNLPTKFDLDSGYPYESLDNVNMRISRTWQWLSERNEHRIAAFTHSKLVGFKNRDYGLIGFLGLESVDNAGIVELKFSRGGWKIVDLAQEKGGVMTVNGSTHVVRQSLEDAKQAAILGNKCIVQEEKEINSSSSTTDNIRFVVKSYDSLHTVQLTPAIPLAVGSTGFIPAAIHIAPVDICIGIGAPHTEIHTQRVEKCVQVMSQHPYMRCLVWTDSQSGANRCNFLSSLGTSAATIGMSVCGQGCVRKIVIDSRAKSTLGHARFALERVLEEVSGTLQRHIRLHLVTSSFHMKRAHTIFARACAALLVAEGHSFEVVCHPCEHTGRALEESLQYTTGDLHLTLEERQRERNRVVQDDDVRYYWE